MCESLGSAGDSPEQWLANGRMGSVHDGTALRAGVPKLCPQWTATVNRAVGGDYDRWFNDGSYVVKAHDGPADPDDDVGVIAADVYRATGDLEGCFWQRSAQDGKFIDNDFAKTAREVTVTVRVSEQFTSHGCGTWKPVK